MCVGSFPRMRWRKVERDGLTKGLERIGRTKHKSFEYIFSHKFIILNVIFCCKVHFIRIYSVNPFFSMNFILFPIVISIVTQHLSQACHKSYYRRSKYKLVVFSSFSFLYFLTLFKKQLKNFLISWNRIKRSVRRIYRWNSN